MYSWFILKQIFFSETLAYSRQMRALLNCWIFFIMFLTFFPLTLKPETQILRTIAPGLVWMGLLLALLLSAERLFSEDYEQGLLEQRLIHPLPLSLWITCKLAVHLFFHLIPIILLCPFIAILFALTPWETYVFLLSFLFGMPALIGLSALAAVFGVGTHQKGAFMALILLPLTLPVLIFGSGAVTMAMQGANIAGFLALLAAMSTLVFGFLPFAIAGIMRLNLMD